MTLIYKNVQQAFPLLCDLVLKGERLDSRVGATRERLHTTFTIQNPDERVSCWEPGIRKDDMFARLAETLWVLGGRSDVQWLERYLPRASQFSDDGQYWRAGYGKRMRHWPGHDNSYEVDQILGVIKELSEHPESRRAVINIWDPATDMDDWKDVPCNNWLHFLQRDGALHMAIGIRSNDLVWGWHGINTFEWSVLQELIANSLDLVVGKQTYLIGSLHMYDRHFQMAADLVKYVEQVERDHDPIYYLVEPTRIGLHSLEAWDDKVSIINTLLDEWHHIDEHHFPEWRKWVTPNLGPYLNATLTALRIRHVAHVEGWDIAMELIEEWAQEEPHNDILTGVRNTAQWKLAAWEQKVASGSTSSVVIQPVAISRTTGTRLPACMEDSRIPPLTEIPQFQEYELKAMGYVPLDGHIAQNGMWLALAPNLALWMKARRSGQAFAPELTVARMVQTMQSLQAAKGRTYGDSWKKHGELLSIYANITRKYDRIEGVLAGGKALPDEDLLDTLVDLTVYCALYLSWLAEPDHNGNLDAAWHIAVESANWIGHDWDAVKLTFQSLTTKVLDTEAYGNDPDYLQEKRELVAQLASQCVAWIRSEFADQWPAFEKKVMEMAA